MKGQRIGYIRVSTHEQNPDRQLEGIEIDKKFIDYASGKDLNRKEFDRMMSYIREGDHVIVHSVDRIARSLVNLRQIVTLLNEKGISIEFKKENLYFIPGKNDPHAVLMLSLMGSFAECELSIMKDRQREGIAIAREKGKYLKRKKKVSNEQMQEIAKELQSGKLQKEILEKYSIGRTTLYLYMKQVKLDVKQVQYI